MNGDPPRISIITPSLNQGEFIRETIESVLAQQYPNLEHIVLDAGSTDGTLDILREYPHLKLVVEPDRGQADAINKGFRMATGDIWGFLNSDDTLLPGALHRVAREIDPARVHHIVMGRCRFIDQSSCFIGVEHPSHFEGHARVLEIWKGHTIPQPAVFWTPAVWRTCGPMDVSLKYHLDYDLFCRFSRRYRFHWVDQVLATYRLHEESKTNEWSAEDRLEDSIRLSRRYWGPWWSPLHWRLAASLAWYRFDRIGRARAAYGRARELARHSGRLAGARDLVLSAVLAPEVGFYMAAYPRLRRYARGALVRLARRLAPPSANDALSAVYMDHTEPWEDGWVGPRYVLGLSREPHQRRLVLSGFVDLTYFNKPLVLKVLVDGSPLGATSVDDTGQFCASLPVPDDLTAELPEVEIQAQSWFIPHRVTRSGDHRPLAWKPDQVRFSS